MRGKAIEVRHPHRHLPTEMLRVHRERTLGIHMNDLMGAFVQRRTRSDDDLVFHLDDDVVPLCCLIIEAGDLPIFCCQ